MFPRLVMEELWKLGQEQMLIKIHFIFGSIVPKIMMEIDWLDNLEIVLKDEDLCDWQMEGCNEILIMKVIQPHRIAATL
jgi:hypothetical protein